jgi:beta-mannosidase
MKRKTNLDWELGYSVAEEIKPSSYVVAKVPGAVQLDIARAENYPDYNYADNYKMFGWMEDVFYTYRTVFERPRLAEGNHLWFVSKGIDYQFEIKFNGNEIHRQEGMFTYVELDLTNDLLDSNYLEITVMPAPKRESYPVDRTQASNVVKPAVSYGWDWHPRLIPLGIWDETYLEERNPNQITDIHLEYVLSDDFSRVEIELIIEATINSTCHFTWQLKDTKGNVVIDASGEIFKSVTKTYSLENPHLWWSHDHGLPYLYTSTFKLADSNNITLQEVERKIGFRKIKLVMNEGSWNEPKEFPKTQSVAPAQLELNGRSIFAKGTNWVNPEIFPGKITKERYKELLAMAVDTNFNIIRTWGGAIVNKESFFEICDELGILVWQDFPLACNNYPDDSHYLSILEQEATSVIKRLRKQE